MRLRGENFFFAARAGSAGGGRAGRLHAPVGRGLRGALHARLVEFKRFETAVHAAVLSTVGVMLAGAVDFLWRMVSVSCEPDELTGEEYVQRPAAEEPLTARRADLLQPGRARARRREADGSRLQAQPGAPGGALPAGADGRDPALRRVGALQPVTRGRGRLASKRRRSPEVCSRLITPM